MAIYLFTSGTTWTIPAGVTSIQVECFGAANGINASPPAAANPGGSYARTNSITVTPGNTLRISIPANGGLSDVWATTVSTGTPVVGATYTTANSCLAKGSSTVPASQVAASIGNLKYAGGSPSTTATLGNGQGGQAGPFGVGGNGGFYGSTLYAAGGGADGGSSASPTQFPYGRGGSGSTQGRGGYYNGSAFISPTQDVLGTTNYVNNVSSIINYGPYGGSGSQQICGGCCPNTYNTNFTNGFIVINTAVASTTGARFLQFF
jgi:hypothetical protein